MKKNLDVLASGLAILALGCSSQRLEKANAPIPDHEDRMTLFAGLGIESANRNLKDLIHPGDIGERVGVAPEHTPYPDTYWPMDARPALDPTPAPGEDPEVLGGAPGVAENGIHDRWITVAEPDEEPENCVNCEGMEAELDASPLEKYLALTDPDNFPLENLAPGTRPEIDLDFSSVEERQAKRDELAARDDIHDAVKWEILNHGNLRDRVAGWFGHCPGWVASALLYDPIQGPTSMRNNGGVIEACDDPSEEGCITFEIGDMNALMAEAHEGAQSRFIGARCDKTHDDIVEFLEENPDKGIRDIEGCNGVNLGAMVIIAGNLLNERANPAGSPRRGSFRNDNRGVGEFEPRPFAIDAQRPFNSGEIWNQPAFATELLKIQVLSEEDAAQMVRAGSTDFERELRDRDDRRDDRLAECDSAGRGGSNSYCEFNPDAQGWVLIEFQTVWVTEFGPNTTVVPGSSSIQKTRMLGIVELDKPLGDEALVNDLIALGEITEQNKDEAEVLWEQIADEGDDVPTVVGGEYLDDDDTPGPDEDDFGVSQLQNHPFVWVALDAAPDFGNRHNPAIKGSVVKEMIAVALGNAAVEEPTCSSPFIEGEAMSFSCESDVVREVCENDAFCCDQTNGSWDGLCVGAACDLGDDTMDGFAAACLEADGPEPM